MPAPAFFVFAPTGSDLQPLRTIARTTLPRRDTPLNHFRILSFSFSLAQHCVGFYFSSGCSCCF